jgi:hypothetical protein
VRRLLSTIAALAAAGIIIPAAAAGSMAKAAVVPSRFGVRLVDVPVSEAHNPRALRYIIDHLAPGSVIHRRILVENQEPQAGHFSVYPDAARIRNGSFVGDAGHTRSELTTWITVQHRHVTLNPQASVMDMVTIRVPRRATRGSHYGVIWAQQVAHVHSARGVAINEVSRVGIRIYLSVGRGGAPPTRFTISSIAGHRSATGRPILTAHVRNTGGLAVDISGTARLTGGPGGTSAGPFQAGQVLTLAPGQSGTVSFAAGRRLPAGPWQARISLVSGLTKESASATIDFSGHLPAAPWIRTAAMTGGGGLGVAAVTLLTVRARRRRGLLTRELA